MERTDYAKSLVAMYQSPPSAASMDNPLCAIVHTKSGPHPVFPLEDLGWKRAGQFTHHPTRLDFILNAKPKHCIVGISPPVPIVSH